MSASTYTDIFCDKCGAWEHGGTFKSAAKARRHVITACGWRYMRDAETGDMMDLCPNCAPPRKTKATPPPVPKPLEGAREISLREIEAMHKH